MQPLFLRGPSITLRAIVLIALSIGIMIADHRWHHLEKARGVIETYIIYPLRYTINLPVKFVDWVDESLTSHQLLLNQNHQYQEAELRYRVQLQKLSVLEKENERLRYMLSASPKVGEPVLVAELLAVDQDPYRQQVVLNKGSNDQVYLGQPIIDAWGVMGQIIYLADESSTAMLISDPSHAIPVQVNRSGLRSTAFGTGNAAELELRYIPHNADIQEGDLIVASGLGQRFPPNYPVAKIVKIERPMGEAFAYVVAEPLAHLDKSREVLLVWHNPPVEDASAETSSEPAEQEKSK